MTTKTDIALTDRLTIVKLLATGKSLEFAATVTKITMPAVQILAEDYGYPDTAKLTWAADLITEETAGERRMTITNHPHPAVVARSSNRTERPASRGRRRYRTTYGAAAR